MKSTKASIKEQNVVANFINAYRRAKRREPEVLYLSKRQIEVMGLEPHEKILGKPWRPYN